MGHAIHYCTGCSIQLREPDFEKGAAFRSEARVYCKNCVPEAVRLRPQQQTDRVGVNTSRIVRVTPPPNPVVLPPEPKAGFPKWGFAAGGAVVIIGLVAAMASSGREPAHRPSEAPPVVAGPGPAAPPPALPPPTDREKAADEAIRKAREFVQASPDDLAGQLVHYEAALKISADTGHHPAALRERDAVVGRQKAVVKTQLDAVDAAVRAACDREEFGAALRRIEEARVRPLGGDWAAELAKRTQDVVDAADKLFAAVKKDAADAQKRGAEDEVRRLTERIDKWEVEKFKSELDKAVAAATPRKPPPPPPPPKAIDAYRKKWTEAMAAASFRDFAGALKKIEEGKAATTDAAVQLESAADLEFLRLAISAEEEALQLISKIPKGTRMTVTCMTEAGTKMEMTGTVVRNENHELELARERGNARIPLGEISSRTLGQILKGKREDKGAAVLCIIDGDVAGAKGLIEGAAAIPDKYWAFKPPPNPAGQSAARKMFYSAEREFRSHARSGDALLKYATLLKDHATTEFVRRNRAIIAARTEGSREFFFVFEDLRKGGSFKAFKSGEELYWKSMAEADPAKPGVNYVEIAFPALTDVEYRCWFYVGGCCTESVTCSYLVSESAEPAGETALAVKQLPAMAFKTHAAHEGRGRPTLRWGWIQVPLPKFATAGPKKVRLLAAEKGFCASQALVSATRQATPTAAEANELERSRLEARGGGRADATLIGHWKLADGAGTAVADSSSSGVDGQLTGGAAWVAATAASPPALKLDGTGWVNLGKDLNLIQGASAVTVAAWIHPDKLAGDSNHNVIVTLSKNTAGNPTNESRLNFSLLNGGAFTLGSRSIDSEGLQSVKSEKMLKTGAWVHLAGTVDLGSNTILLYVNGMLVPSTGTVKFSQKTYPNSPSSFGIIGAEDDCSRYFFNGRLADIRLYTRLLSPEEIADLAASPIATR